MDFIYRFNIDLMIKLPHIIIIDFVYLIFCYSTYLDKEIELIKLLNKKSNTNIKPDITNEIEKELIFRPDFTLFIDFLKSNYKNAEIFLYIPAHMYHDYSNIDIILNNKYEKINKFILTSMHNYYETIIEILKDKYPSLNKNKQKVFDNQFIIFTTHNSNIKDYEKTIICSDYEYTYYYDIYDKIINTYKINPNVFDDTYVLKFCEQNEIPIYNKNGSIKQKDLLYQNILKMYYYKKYKLSEVSKKEDTFFKDYIKENQKK